ncbi:MAG: O-acetyl-ADP-ribose deacetylase [Cyanobacteria bacterium J06649_11]
MEVILSDITKLQVKAIVNAANTSLLGGGGVDGAIHRAAGKELVMECRSLGGCKTGDAKLTKGYNLPVDFIIHTVGPVWQGGNNNEAELLASCYRKSIQIALERKFESLAFPCISTGIYKYPKNKAAEIAVKTCLKELENDGSTLNQLKVIFCCFDEDNYHIYQQILNTI